LAGDLRLTVDVAALKAAEASVKALDGKTVSIKVNVTGAESLTALSNQLNSF